jgi:hypothetical protein
MGATLCRHGRHLLSPPIWRHAERHRGFPDARRRYGSAGRQTSTRCRPFADPHRRTPPGPTSNAPAGARDCTSATNIVANTESMNGPVRSPRPRGGEGQLVTLDDVKDTSITTTTDDAYLQRRVEELSRGAAVHEPTLQIETRDQVPAPARPPYPWQIPGGAVRRPTLPLARHRGTLVTRNDIELAKWNRLRLDAELGQLTRYCRDRPLSGALADAPITVEFRRATTRSRADVAVARQPRRQGPKSRRMRDPRSSGKRGASTQPLLSLGRRGRRYRRRADAGLPSASSTATGSGHR